MRFTVCVVSAVMLVTGGAVLGQAPAQAPSTTTMASGLQRKYLEIKRNILETAEKMPEADFAFRPTPVIRNFGELFGHIANSQFNNCSSAKGEPNPRAGVDNERKTTRAEIVKALQDSFAYCDGAYSALTDATANELIMQEKNQQMRGYALMNNVWHDTEMYGHAATYLRLKGLLVREGMDDLSRHK